MESEGLKQARSGRGPRRRQSQREGGLVGKSTGEKKKSPSNPREGLRQKEYELKFCH